MTDTIPQMLESITQQLATIERQVKERGMNVETFIRIDGHDDNPLLISVAVFPLSYAGQYSAPSALVSKLLLSGQECDYQHLLQRAREFAVSVKSARESEREELVEATGNLIERAAAFDHRAAQMLETARNSLQRDETVAQTAPMIG